MNPDFKFAGQTLHLIFDSPPDFRQRYSSTVTNTPMTELRPHAVAPSDQRFVLVSQTGGTNVTVSNDTAIGQTRYYGTYSEPPVWADRLAYTERKIRALVAILVGSGARCQFAGVTTVARWTVPQTDRPSVRRDAASVLGMDWLGARAPSVVDFSARASWRSGNWGFFNVTLSWFQTRAIEMVVPAARQGGPLTVSVREWDGRLVDEGLELRFDANNKHGLYHEKRDWSVDDIVSTLKGALEEMPTSFDQVATKLRSLGS